MGNVYDLNQTNILQDLVQGKDYLPRYLRQADKTEREKKRNNFATVRMPMSQCLAVNSYIVDCYKKKMTFPMKVTWKRLGGKKGRQEKEKMGNLQIIF